MTRLWRAVRAARAYASQYLHRGKHRTAWGAHSTSQLVAMLAAGRAIQAALEDGAAAPDAVPRWPALPAPNSHHPGERGPAPLTPIGSQPASAGPGMTPPAAHVARASGNGDPHTEGETPAGRRWPGGAPSPLAPDPSDPWWCTCTPPCWQQPCKGRALAALVRPYVPEWSGPTVLDLQPIRDPALTAGGGR